MLALIQFVGRLCRPGISVTILSSEAPPPTLLIADLILKWYGMFTVARVRNLGATANQCAAMEISIAKFVK